MSKGRERENQAPALQITKRSKSKYNTLNYVNTSQHFSESRRRTSYKSKITTIYYLRPKHDTWSSSCTWWNHRRWIFSSTFNKLLGDRNNTTEGSRQVSEHHECVYVRLRVPQLIASTRRMGTLLRANQTETNEWAAHLLPVKWVSKTVQQMVDGRHPTEDTRCPATILATSCPRVHVCSKAHS